MKKLILVVLLASLFACRKDKDNDDELPKKLQDVISNTTCVHDPVLGKYLLDGEVVYIMNWTQPMSEQGPAFYDKDGNEMSPTFSYNTLEFIKTVWKCKP